MTSKDDNIDFDPIEDFTAAGEDSRSLHNSLKALIFIGLIIAIAAFTIAEVSNLFEIDDEDSLDKVIENTVDYSIAAIVTAVISAIIIAIELTSSHIEAIDAKSNSTVRKRTISREHIANICIIVYIIYAAYLGVSAAGVLRFYKIAESENGEKYIPNIVFLTFSTALIAALVSIVRQGELTSEGSAQDRYIRYGNSKEKLVDPTAGNSGVESSKSGIKYRKPTGYNHEGSLPKNLYPIILPLAAAFFVIFAVLSTSSKGPNQDNRPESFLFCSFICYLLGSYLLRRHFIRSNPDLKSIEKVSSLNTSFEGYRSLLGYIIVSPLPRIIDLSADRIITVMYWCLFSLGYWFTTLTSIAYSWTLIIGTEGGDFKVILCYSTAWTVAVICFHLACSLTTIHLNLNNINISTTGKSYSLRGRISIPFSRTRIENAELSTFNRNLADKLADHLYSLKLDSTSNNIYGQPKNDRRQTLP